MGKSFNKSKAERINLFHSTFLLNTFALQTRTNLQSFLLNFSCLNYGNMTAYFEAKFSGNGQKVGNKAKTFLSSFLEYFFSF